MLHQLRLDLVGARCVQLTRDNRFTIFARL